jgi:PAS domain S-box-containing protein
VFTQHHLELIQAAAKQVSVAVNNAHLYLLIRDQAERLGGMLRSQQIESSRLLAILESVVDGVIVTDAHGQVSVFNRAAEQILGLPPDEVVGRSLDDFSSLFGIAGRAWLETVRRWSNDPNSFEIGETFSQEISLDERRVSAVNLAPVFSPHEFLGTVSIFRDITHLIEVDRMKSEFVATVSHELRTPLTSIKGYVDVLLMGAAGEVNEQQATFLQVVHENTERLNILVNDLLEVSRIEAGKIFLNRQAVDLVELAGDVATDYRLRSQEEKKQMRIAVETGWNPPLAFADPDRLRQILDNLVGNAYNYTEARGEITIAFRQSSDFIEVGVQDNGVGIVPKDQMQIFDRFYRGDAPLVTSTAGTGLGLSIVRYLVEQHGGEIWIESSGVPGEGSTFYFTVPIYPEEAIGGG